MHKDIYPTGQELKKENDGFENASFMDLESTISDKQFILKLYNKCDAFPFTIVRMPYLCSNIPSKIFYATIGSEILRIASCTTKKEDFISSSIQLLERMNKQGAVTKLVKKELQKLYSRHSSSFAPFFSSIEDLTNSLNIN